MNKLSKRELLIIHGFIIDAIDDAEFDIKYCAQGPISEAAYCLNLEDLNGIRAKLEYAIQARPGIKPKKDSELPILDHKYDLLKHHNVRFTEDGGASPYRHNPEPVPVREIVLDVDNLSDYEIL